MKSIRIALLAIACTACAIPSVSLAQWMWVDKDGRKILSDQAPPNDIPAKNILRQPGVRKAQDFAVAPVTAEPVKPVLVAPKTGKDPALEAKKKAAEAAEAEKLKIATQERDRARGENCDRAKRAKANFDSGVRIARTNAKGEKEFLDDAQRAVEIKRTEAIITRDCGAAAS